MSPGCIARLGMGGKLYSCYFRRGPRSNKKSCCSEIVLNTVMSNAMTLSNILLRWRFPMG